MKLIFYIFLISQFFNFIEVLAEKVKENLSGLNPVKWEKLEENDSSSLKNIIWKSYKNDEIYFKNKNEESSVPNNIDKLSKKRINQSSKLSVFSITEIEPFLPLNNFLKYGNFQTSTRWKSSFDGGLSKGIGQQNNSFVFDYGISDSSLFSIYITGADDDLYNSVGGQKINYYWQSYAISFKKKIIDEVDFDFGLSFVSTLEYWRHASGSETAKSIYNQKDDSFGKDKFEDIVGALSFPISKNLNKNLTVLVVPGVTFLPEKLGSKGIGKNAYGNNFYVGSGIVYDLAEDLNLLLSYTTPLGPGNNYFGSALSFSR